MYLLMHPLHFIETAFVNEEEEIENLFTENLFSLPKKLLSD